MHPVISRTVQSNVIWLRGTPVGEASLLALVDVHSHQAPPKHVVTKHTNWYHITALLAAVMMQAGALTLFIASGAGARPWSAAAIFGLGAAIAAGLLTWKGRIFHHASVMARDASPYDAVTLALVLATSTFVGVVGAMLLLPAVTIVSRVVRRVSKQRAVEQWDAHLLLIVIIALIGLCEHGGWKGWIIAGSVFVTTPILQTFFTHSRLRPQRSIWRMWAKTSALCIAIAFTEIGQGGIASLTLFKPIMTAFSAGILWGTGLGLCHRVAKLRLARISKETVPFLAVAFECAITGQIPFPTTAAATLLATALFVSGTTAFRTQQPVARPLGSVG